MTPHDLPDLPLSPPDPPPDTPEEWWAEASETVRARYGFGRTLWAKHIAESYEHEIEQEVERIRLRERKETQAYRGGWL